MKQYIDKDALVAEIRKRLLPVIRDKHYDEWEEGQDSERIAILNIINTLEVKEIDLDKYYIDFLQKEWFSKPGSRTISKMMAFTAKHFFELGLKAQKG
jgi:hypothetical protein